MDQICITMPDNLRDFMIAMAVVQDYQLQLAVGAARKERELNYQFTFRMKEQFQFFEPSIRVVKDNMPVFDYSGWPEQHRGDFDCFINFDFERAKIFSRKAHEHIIGGFNSLIGSGAGIWPIMKYVLEELRTSADIASDILFIPWDESESQQFYGYLRNNHPEYEIISDGRLFEKFEETPKDFLTYINCFSIVIGKASAVTYAAASLKKAVIEIFANNEECELFGNNGLQHYRHVIGQPSAAMLWLAWEELWEGLLSDTSNQEQPVSTDSQASTANSVEEKSLEQ